ncbi:MAG: Na+/H+ antiporter subunit D [Pseudomonadota bacterium]
MAIDMGVGVLLPFLAGAVEGMAPKPAYDYLDAYVKADVTAQAWLIIAPIAITMVAGTILLMFRRRVAWQFPIALIALVLLAINNIALLMWILEDGPQTMTMGRWLPPFGISFSVDLFGAGLNAAASLVAIAGVIFASREIEWLGSRYGFYPFLMLLMTGVCGSFLTGDLFNLYVWFEVLLISSFGMFILGSERLQLDGAIKYAFLNLIATTLFLIATGLTYAVFGTLNMADLMTRAAAYVEAGEGSAPLYTISALFLIAFGMKAAAFPVNFWLPASYHTPRVVVQALFAGLLTKVGLYALIRSLTFVFGAVIATSEVFFDIVALVAALTMVLAGFGALAQSDVRKLAGYTVISGIGMMLAGMAMNTQGSLSATMAYAVHSMVTMTALYMVLGLAIALTGSHAMQRMGGIYAVRPLFSALFLILVFAVAGLPPFSGFWPKLALVRAGLEGGHGWLVAAILFSGFLVTIALGRVWAHAFWRGGPEGTPDGQAAIEHIGVSKAAGLVSNQTVAPVTALVAAAIALGIFAGPFFALTDQAASGLQNSAPYIESVFPKGPPVSQPMDLTPASTGAQGEAS